jgi:hypothetical protein
LLSSPQVVTAAEDVLNAIVASYLAPNLSLREIRDLADQGKMNFLVEFGEACRLELELEPTRWRTTRN